MGNRAVILFGDKVMGKRDRHTGVYLHWNGGPESIYCFVKALASYARSQDEGATPRGVVSDALAARFIQLTSNYFAGTGSDFLTVYAIPNPRSPLTNHDDSNHGVYVVHPDFSLSRVGRGKVDEKGNQRYWTDEERLEEFKDVLRHEYWKKDEDGSNLLDEIRTYNDTAFLKKWSSDGMAQPYEFLEAELPIEKELKLCAELTSTPATPLPSAPAPEDAAAEAVAA